MERWSIYIDVEGFSTIYREDKARALGALGELMRALYRVGSQAFSSSPDRLFVHQFGDGFVVVSDFPETAPSRPLAICLAVMRHLIGTGVATKAAVSAGDFADVFGCYPPEVQAAVRDHHHAKLGDGLMTIIPVMGLALIAPYRLSTKRSGAVLLLDTSAFAGVPTGVKAFSTGPSVIDWLKSDFPMVKEICEASGLTYLDGDTAQSCLQKYLDANPRLSKEWISSTLESVGMAYGSS